MFSGNRIHRALLSAVAIAALSGTAGIARAEPTSPAPAAPPAPTAAAPAQSSEEDRTPVTVSFLYPLATNANRPDVTSNADVSPLYGRVGKIEGGQLGGVVVHAARGVDGVQLGGVATISGGAVSGVQLGGVVNVSTASTTGLQLSGAANVATSDVTGAQVAPVNVAGPVDGVQLGIINVGRNVRGLQLGLVNIAEDVDGAAIGLVSISKDSVHPIVWASNLQYMNAGVKFSTKYVFTMLGAHYGTHEADFDKVGATAAIGGHIPLPASFDVEVQGSFTQLVPSRIRSDSKENSWVAPQVVAGYSVASHFRVFAGGGVRLPISVNLGRDVSRPEVLAGIQF